VTFVLTKCIIYCIVSITGDAKMSIIIKNAYVWEESYDSLIRFLHNIALNFPVNIYYRYIKELPENIIEQKTLCHHNGTFLYYAIKKDSSKHESGYDLDLSAEFMVYQHDDKIIIQFFGNELMLHYMDNIVLPKYDYSDNADNPDNVSELEWVERKKWWESLFYDYRTDKPVHCGLSYQIYSDYAAWEINKLYTMDNDK
jgi:hypothetical protein